jgi:putative membrane protein
VTAIQVAPTAWAGGFGVGWGLMGVVFWILLIVLIVFLVRGMKTSAVASGGPAVRLLEERYARGEITREEYVERRSVLRGTSPGAPGDDLP